MNKPTKRQQSIIDLVPDCETLCDVGCDHGIVGATALLKNKAQKTVFIDVSKRCLQKAETLCKQLELPNCTFICQDGLGDINCDCAVIAGMGGLEITKILSQASALPDKLVLQPMRDVPTVRKFVSKFYSIVVDKIVQEGKFYDIMYLQRGSSELTEDEINFGLTNLTHPTADFHAYLVRELRIANKILLSTEKSQVRKYVEDIMRLKEEQDNASNTSIPRV